MSTAAIKASSTVLDWSERGLVPDSVLRAGIRRLCRQRLKDIKASDIEASGQMMEAFVEQMNASDVALVPDIANVQHYEVPPEFFSTVLGSHAKYSCCYWDDGAQTLDHAEADALRISSERAGIEDGMDVLDLGCGWGSLSLWIAAHYPACQVTSVSNSEPQGRHIRRMAAERGLTNINVITADMNNFQAIGQFDRIVSVEMFEHMRNYRELFSRLSTWLKPDGKFFMHVFSHKAAPYRFDHNDKSDWIAQHFFTGGVMPSHKLIHQFPDLIHVEEEWCWTGDHYERTARDWLRNFDSHSDEIDQILASVYGTDAGLWKRRWRLFFLATMGLFGHDGGQEWGVSHYLMREKSGS